MEEARDGDRGRTSAGWSDIARSLGIFLKAMGRHCKVVGQGATWLHTFQWHEETSDHSHETPEILCQIQDHGAISKPGFLWMCPLKREAGTLGSALEDDSRCQQQHVVALG